MSGRACRHGQREWCCTCDKCPMFGHCPGPFICACDSRARGKAKGKK